MIQKKICEIHNTQMILGGYPCKYYFCPECHKEQEISQAEKYNQSLVVLHDKLGENGLNALLTLLKTFEKLK